MPAKRRKPRALTKIVTLAVALVLSLILAEIALRLFVFVPGTPFLRDFDPVCGLRYKKNLAVTLTYPEFSIRFSTNSRGFRGPEPPPSSDGCVLFFGDSFTEGWGVDDGEEYPSLVRAALDERYGAGRIPVINAAMAAAGNGRWVKLLRGDFADYRPRLVVFQLYENDFGDNVAEGLFTLSTSGELVELPVRKSFMRRLQPVLEWVPGLEQSRLFTLLRFARLPVAGRGRRPEGERVGPSPRAEELLLALVEESLSICRARGWPTAMLSVMLGDEQVAHLRALCERYETPLIDIDDREQHPEYYFEANKHWTPAGHRMVADLVLGRLLVEGRHLPEAR